MWVDNNSSHKWTIREPGQLERTYCIDCPIYRRNIQLGAKMGIKPTGIKTLVC